MSSVVLNRRRMLQLSGAAALGLAARSGWGQTESELPPCRVVTHGPKFHWFAYYDKLQFDPSMRYLLAMEVDFQHRSPRVEDTVRIGMVDLKDENRWIELGSSSAWCWQQGCMLQWLPGSDRHIVWNDRAADHYVCHVMDIQSGEKRTIDSPIYTVAADGRTAVAPDFRRINDMRPGYGYTGLPDPLADQLAPADAGISRVDLQTGQIEPIISIAQVAALGTLPGGEQPGAKHYFNHLLFNPDGSRFIFLHRWRTGKSWKTRMLTAEPDGGNVRIVDSNGLTSHFIWRDPKHILAFSNQPSHGARFYLFEDADGGAIEPIGTDVMTVDGHCSYLPGGKWIINDTYPDKNRIQTLYLYEVASGRRVDIGRFPMPPEYQGEWRCDLHPRIAPDGRTIVVDAPDGANGRQQHLIDVSGIVG